MPGTVDRYRGEYVFSERALLLALLDRIPVSIYFKDGEGRFLLTSRGLYERLGCTSMDGVVGRTDSDFFDATHADKAARDESEILDGSVGMIECVEQELWPNGRSAWVSTIKLPLLDGDGKVVGTFGISMDVTRHKRTEDALRVARDEAQAMGEELEATLTDLVETQDQLLQAQKLEAIGQLAAGVAHEINTPIQFVTDNTHFLADSLALVSEAYAAAARVVEEARESHVAETAIAEFDRIHQSNGIGDLLADLPDAALESLEGTERVAEIVGALKAFAHPGADAGESVDLNDVISSTIIVSRNEWKYVAEIETELAKDLPIVVGNRGRLQQVLLILIVNSAQAIASLESEHKGKITVGTRVLDDSVEVWVHDTGPGIPSDIANRVFEPFFTTKDVGVGSGQGLALAHSIVVDQHHGSFGFTSSADEGTRFSIRLPIEAPH